MALTAGEKLGPYEILDKIGAGGMGEVYRARDTRLNRDVAIKVSNAQFSERFEREAHAVAALNHPNICHLYDVGPNYLVMEFVDGETLASPLPLDTCLNYARQIVEAIEAAHDKGIVHRDLKPANIKITPNGLVKVLDFGLAKALESDLPTNVSQDSPTLSMAMTRAGMILGTAAYMAPEQAKARPADRRADIWSFGVVLFEMLEGKQTFTGETAAETLASVLKEEIKFDRLPKDTPPAVRRLLERCLNRDVKLRLQAIGEARIILDDALALKPTTTLPQEITAPRKTIRSWLPWAVSTLLLLALAGMVVWHFQPTPASIVARFPIRLGEGQQFTTTNRLALAISPDGSQIAYVANLQLYLRSLPDLAAHAIPGSEFSNTPANLAFSPDGKSLAFTTQTDNTVKRIATNGGTAVTICPFGAINPSGLEWSASGIIFSAGKDIWRVSPNGGTPEVIVHGKDGELATTPHMLPGGEVVIFTSAAGAAQAQNADWDKARIVAQNLKSGARKVLHEGGTDGRYLPTGHLVYVLGATLFAVSFDLKHLEISGGATPLVEGIQTGAVGAAHFSFAGDGSMVYIPGGASTGVLGGGQQGGFLALIDRKSAVDVLKNIRGPYQFPRITRDGKFAAYESDDGSKDSAIWIAELSGEHAPNRLTLTGTGANRYPIWSTDGKRVSFQSDREGDAGIWWQRADGTGAAERLTKPDKGAAHIPDSWSPDGQTFSFTEVKGDFGSIWTYSLHDKKAVLFAAAPGKDLRNSAFSPDGHWIAYGQGDLPATQIYVQAFPAASNPIRYQVLAGSSANGSLNARQPAWSPDGKELFFLIGTQVGDVGVVMQPSFTFSVLPSLPRPFYPSNGTGVRNWDVHPDGKHFLGMVSSNAVAASAQPGVAAPEIQVVLNWFEDVKQRTSGR